jgi:hypothetical protein
MTKNMGRRKVVQQENTAEYNKALITLKAKVREMEGQDMRETIQDRVNTWFVENRHPESGEYPDFPDEEDGGSKLILNPPIVEVEEPEADAKDAKGKGKVRHRADELATPLTQPGSVTPPQPRHSQDAKGKKEEKGKKGKKGKKTGGNDDEGGEATGCPAAFVKGIEGGVQEYVNTWQDRDESTNFFQVRKGHYSVLCDSGCSS